MPRAAQIRETPLSLRLAKSDLSIIDRAAKLKGRSRTQFMRDAAVQAAEDALMENAVLRMSAKGFAAFVAELERPPLAAAELVETLSRPAPWERSGAEE